jgi:hypothetical protein
MLGDIRQRKRIDESKDDVNRNRNISQDGHRSRQQSSISLS